MEQVAGALIRWPMSDALQAPFNSIPQQDFIFELDPSDNIMYRYFCGNPMSNNPPLWSAFHSGPPPVSVHPVGFDAIFGATEPVGSEMDIVEWHNQLGRFRDNKRPDWCIDVMEAAAKIMLSHYGMGSLLPYRLTNGAEIVAFPNVDKKLVNSAPGNYPKMYTAPALLVYELTMFAVAQYQLACKAVGIPVTDPLSILKFLFGGQQ